MTTKPRRAIFAFLAVLLVWGSPPAAAQDRTAAEAAFREGRELMKAGNWAKAIESLELSQRLDPAIGTLTNLGVCNENLGKLATAWRQLNEAADLASRNGEADRAEAIRTRAQKLETRLSRLLLTSPKQQPAGLIVSRDGVDVTPLLGTPVPIDGGRYVIAARAEGFEPFEKTVEIHGEGETIKVEIPALEPVGATAPPPAAAPTTRPTVPAPPADQPQNPLRTRRRIALGVGVGGAAITAVGLVFGLRARSKYNDSEAHCDADNLCDDEGLALRDSAFTNANLANVFVGVGLAAAAGGTVLWFLSQPKPQADRSAVRVTPHASAGWVGISVRGGF